MADNSKKGPNQIKDADSRITSVREGRTKIILGKDSVGSYEPISIPGLLDRTSRDYPDHAAMVHQDLEGKWQTITFSEYKRRVEHMAKVFIKLGLERFDAVSVIAFNSPEWFITELAAIHAGGVICGVYTTNSPEATQHVLESSRTAICIVDDPKQMEKVNSIRHQLPHLKAVVQTMPPYAPYVKREDGMYRWSELVAMNVDDVEEEYKRRLADIAINECCCLVYTSGTVGVPKGCMLNHDNLTWDAYSIGRRLDHIEYGAEIMVSYLPLSHVAAQMIDIFLSLYFGATMYFADKDALKGTLLKTLLAARPTRLLGVPRVFEKIYEKMQSVAAQNSALKKMIGGWAKGVTLEHHQSVMEGKPHMSWQYKLARSIVLSKVKQALGLDRCATLVTAAAPTPPEIKKYFMSLDMPLMEAFGMSETAGAHSMTIPDLYNFATIGKPLPGVETKIINKDENGHGEICMRGRHICMGYLNEPEKTNEALDEDGWLHSGDVGYLDENNFLYITGRIKELIITAGGENVPPVHIEQLVKNELGFISFAFLVGDQRKYLTMLVTIKTELEHETGVPKDELHPEAVVAFKGLGLNYTKMTQVLADGPDPKVLKLIQDGIDRANKKATSNAQRVQKFAILPKDFSTATGELGPTLKIKRKEICKKYHDVIESLYK